MKRLLLAILLLILVTISVPGLRQRAAPRVGAALGWVGEKLEGPATPILNPWREINTKSEMARIANALMIIRNQGRPPPAPSDFQVFIVEQEVDEEGTDHWGTPYMLELANDSAYIRSAGRDLTPATDDDILVTIRYRLIDVRRRRR